MLGAVDDIVRRGRARGLGVTLVTQRSAVLNKDVLTQCEVLVALRTPHPNDRKPIADWIAVHGTDEQHKEMMDSLAGLGHGEAWILSAAWLNIFKKVQIRAKWTFDSSRTPEPGQRRAEPRVLAKVDLAKLTAAMKETVERAAANDPAKLKAKVAQLEAELQKKPAPAPAPPPQKAKPERTVKVKPSTPILKPRAMKRFEKLVAKFERHGHMVDSVGAAVISAAHGLSKALTLARPAAELLGPWRDERLDGKRQAPIPPPIEVQPVKLKKVAPDPINAPSLVGKGERKILTAVAQYRTGVTREQLTVLTGYKRSSRDAYLSRLSAAGLVGVVGNVILAREAGLNFLGPNFEPLPTGAALIEHWRSKLPTGKRALFEAILAAPGS